MGIGSGIMAIEELTMRKLWRFTKMTVFARARSKVVVNNILALYCDYTDKDTLVICSHMNIECCQGIARIIIHPVSFKTTIKY